MRDYADEPLSLLPSDDDAGDGDAELMARFWALHAAVLKRDGLEKRVRRGPVDQDTFDRSVAAAQAVIEARAALHRHLVATGWRPPDLVVEDRRFSGIPYPTEADSTDW